MATNVDDVAINPEVETDASVIADDTATDAAQPQLEGATETEGVEQPGQQATPSTEDAPEWFKADLVKLKYRGAEVSPKDYNHAKELMQKGWSYEQAMAGIAQQKQEYEANKQRFADYEKLDEAFKQNPAFAQRIQQMYLEAQGQQAPEQAQSHGQQLAPELMEKFKQYDGFIAQAQNAQADTAVRGEIESLKGKYSTENWDAVTETGFSFLRDVLKHAHDNRFPSIEAAYRDYTFERVANNAKMAATEQVANQRQRQARQGIVSTGAQKPAQAAPPVDISGKSYDELTEMAKRGAGVG